MLCPRCGLENLATADQCARCGTPLVDYTAERPWWNAVGTLGGGQDASPPPARAADDSSSWLASALRGGPTPSETPQASADGNLLPPWLSQPNSEQRRSPFGADDVQGWPGMPPGVFPPAEPPSPGGALVPGGYQPGRQLDLSGWPSTNREPTPRGGGFGIISDSSLGRHQQPQSLGPGAALKGGRYRLLQPFQAAPQLRPQGGEPPLMLALDSNLAGGRLLIQELPLQHGMADGGEQVRRLVANRLQAVSESGVTAKLLDQFTEGGRQFIVFELPSGDLLLDRLHRARGPLDETSAIRYALQIVDALALLERQQPPVVHGNLSPANVVLRPSGNVMLVGQSAVLMLPPSIASSYGVAGGVPGYSAPEQARGTATTRSDLYAACAILQHAVTGSAPPPRANWMHPPARRQNPNVSLELEEVLGRGLRPSATQRYGSAQELRDALEPLATGRRTLVPDDLRNDPIADSLMPVRNARGRLELPRRRADSRPMLLIAIVLFLLIGLGAGALYATTPRPSGTGTAGNPTPNQIAADYQSRGIGISAGELIFDTQRPDTAAKQAGALAISANDYPAALAAYTRAEAADPSDAEAAIYAENMGILISKASYVTLAVGVAFGMDDDAARSELQGVFLLQQFVNHPDASPSSNMLPNGVKLRVEIANSGAVLSDVSVVSGFLLNILQEGNAQHFVGLVGWPQADETQLAVTTLKPANLAVVAPTASPDDVVGLGANFFPMVPADSVQGSELADAAVSKLGAQRILLLTDAKSPASVHTTNGFQQELASKYAGNGVRLDTAPYTSGSAASLDVDVAAANAQRDDLIFVACGDNCDASVAALAQLVSAQYWSTGAPPNVLVDSHGYSQALVGAGSTSVAQLVRSNPKMFQQRNIYVTLLADANVWNDQTDLGPDILYNQPQLIQGAYTAQFGSAEPDSTTMLSYDATHLLISASSPIVHVQNGAVGVFETGKVNAGILTFTSAHPFMGVSGAVGYSESGWMSAKALFVERIVSNGVVAQPTFEPGDIAGGKAAFCGAATDCKPS